MSWYEEGVAALGGQDSLKTAEKLQPSFILLEREKSNI